jgi:hypothetical protein
MVDRRPVQQEHERAVVENFLSWLNTRSGTQFKVIEEPNPPDAIIQSVRITRWVEVTDAFWSDAYAKDLYSFVTAGEEHKPIGPGPSRRMDEKFAHRFVDALAKKLKKRSYLPFLKRYGKGYLIIPMHYPWFDASTVRGMKDLWRQKQPIEDLGCFKEVYITFSSLNRPAYQRWRV